jgi:predicted metalloprotease with PDZ domain
VTARAVILFDALDHEIRIRTESDASLDDVARALMERREVSRDALRRIVEDLTGAPSEVLDTPLLEGTLEPSGS